jgi:hypothetical protein
MPNENRPQNPSSAAPAIDPRAAQTTPGTGESLVSSQPLPQAPKTQLPAANAPDQPKDEKPNLTRESFELTLASRYLAEGKSVEESKALAKKRALEMVP